MAQLLRIQVKRDIKKGFFDEPEQANVVDYRKKFFDEMKERLSYLVEFNKDGSMLSKKFPQDCAFDRPNKKLVMMIIDDKSSFSSNDG